MTEDAVQDPPSPPARAPGRLSPFWQAQLVIWPVVGLADLATRITVFHSLSVALSTSVLVTPLMMLVAGVLALAYRRAGLAGSGPVRIAAILVPASLAGALAVGGASALLRRGVGWRIPDFDLAEALVAPTTFTFAILLGWSLGYVWLVAERARQASLERAARAEAEALAAELGRLRLQLDPHFLFNALNGIATEIADRPPAALAMVRELSAYLRTSLETVDRAVVPVAEEVAGVEAYLNIQRARFEDGLAAVLRMDPAVAGWPVACFLLQPLVENAFKHGLRRPRLELDIALVAIGPDLSIRVRNSGTLAGRPGRRADSTGGLGLSNLRRRLALHYPDRHRFTLTEDGGQVTAELVLTGPPCSAS